MTFKKGSEGKKVPTLAKEKERGITVTAKGPMGGWFMSEDQEEDQHGRV